MRQLTEAENISIQNNKYQLDNLLKESMSILADFFKNIGADDAPLVVNEPRRFLPLLADFLDNEKVGDEDFSWLNLRLGLYIGEYFCQDMGGMWFLNEYPDTRYFNKIVVGNFSGCSDKNAMIDPFEISAHYLSSPPSRNLVVMINEINAELSKH